MENLIPVLVILGFIGFILWKNKDKIVQLSDKFTDRGQKPEVVKPEPIKPEVPYKVPDPVVTVSPIEVKPEIKPAAPQADFGPQKPWEFSPAPPPSQMWANSRVLAGLAGGINYTVYGPAGFGYAIAGAEGGAGALFYQDGNPATGSVGAATIVDSGKRGMIVFAADRACNVWLDPILP